MSMYDEAKEADRKAVKTAANASKDVSYEAAHLRENLNGLGRAVKDMSGDTAHMAESYLREIAAELKASGAEAVRRTEARIRQEPAQSLALAFAAGILASILLRRRHA